jgi:hypothetical protein
VELGDRSGSDRVVHRNGDQLRRVRDREYAQPLDVEALARVAHVYQA